MFCAKYLPADMAVVTASLAPKTSFHARYHTATTNIWCCFSHVKTIFMWGHTGMATIPIYDDVWGQQRMQAGAVRGRWCMCYRHHRSSLRHIPCTILHMVPIDLVKANNKDEVFHFFGGEVRSVEKLVVEYWNKLSSVFGWWIFLSICIDKPTVIWSEFIMLE